MLVTVLSSDVSLVSMSWFACCADVPCVSVVHASTRPQILLLYSTSSFLHNYRKHKPMFLFSCIHTSLFFARLRSIWFTLRPQGDHASSQQPLLQYTITNCSAWPAAHFLGRYRAPTSAGHTAQHFTQLPLPCGLHLRSAYLSLTQQRARPHP